MTIEKEAGVLIDLFNQERYTEVETRARQMTKHFARHDFGWRILGVVLNLQGRVAEALVAMQEAIRLAPENSEAHYTLGLILDNLGRHPDAELSYRRALHLQPEFAEAHSNLGQILYDFGRLTEAEDSLRRAQELRPDIAGLHCNLGKVLAKLARPAEAEESFRRALEIDPDLAESHSGLGSVLHALRRPEEAEPSFRRALQIRPDHAETHCNLGLTLATLGRFYEAEACYLQSLEFCSSSIAALMNLGNCLASLGRLEEAELHYLQVLQINPDFVEAHYGLGILFNNSGRLAEAEIAYRHAIAIKPGYVEARHNLSLLLLQRGKLQEGWQEYEARHDPRKLDPKTLPPPIAPDVAPSLQQWTGEPLHDKSLLIWPEQGFGDVIQFARYLPLIRARGINHLALVCQSALAALFSTQNLADQVICIDDWRPEMGTKFDYWCYLLSLPLYFGTTLENLPAKLPYLAAEPGRIASWGSCLPKTGLRVALVWKGSPTHVNDRERSLPSIASLIPLWSIPGIAFISLQKGNGENEASSPSVIQPLTHLGNRISDFADVAAILSQVDLLICVDTAVAHLAGALAKPCWVLLPFSSDWRWFEEHTDSPWYPGIMRLFRQMSDRNWDSVVAQVAEALQEWSAKRQSEYIFTDTDGSALLNQREHYRQHGEESIVGLKRFNLLPLSATTGIRTLVQSGAGLGASIEWAIQCRFDAIYSVEPEVRRHDKASIMFSAYPQVHLAQDNSISFFRAQGPAIPGPKLVYLNARFAGGNGAHQCASDFRDDFGLLDEVASIQKFFGPEDILIIDNAWVYQSGNFQFGTCPPIARCWHQLAKLEALFACWSDTHFLCVLHSDQGYFCLIPNAFEKQYPEWLNILPHDAAGSQRT
ncbi:MAG: tetratricopeptide repeat protein [Rhodocyclales bacterium]|nr:tetratricopeptide repeat protein [Rhodocyclales bacterium]